MKKHLWIISFVLLLNFNLAAQVEREPEISTIKTEKGMSIFSRVPPLSFSFLVAGKNPQGSQKSDGNIEITTDEGGLYVYFVKTSDFLDAKQKYKTSDILAIQRQNDIAGQEKSFQKELHIDTIGAGTLSVDDLRKGSNEKAELETVFWGYQIPVGENPGRVLYQTVVVGDLVLMIGTVFDSSVKDEEVRSFFTRTLESITLLPSQQTKITPKKPATKRKSKRN